MANQISLFVENKPGKLEAVMSAITANHIDIKAFTVANADKFGVMKFLVNEPVKAREFLRDAGYAVALEEVLVVEIQGMPGSMQQIARTMTEQGINIDNAYSFSCAKDKALFVMETSQLQKTRELLEGNGYTVLSDVQIDAL